MIPQQDKKCIIVMDENIPLGRFANTAAILDITLGRYFIILLTNKTY